jgi:L-cysteine S-thiosulfotransferase
MVKSPRIAAVAFAMAASVAFGQASFADGVAKYQIVDENTIPKPLTSTPGNAAKGLKTIINRKKGNCLSCHVAPGVDQPYQGKIGPEFKGVAGRWSEPEIRMIVVNAKVNNPDTIMPGFHRVDDLHRVMKKFKGKPILSAQEVEDIVAYLITLKEE